MIQKFRKRSVIIEAEMLTIHNAVKLAKWCNGQLFDDPEEGGYCIIINTLEGDMTARLSDYIIKEINGEFYPCKNEIFLKTYDEVVG